jgi:hypothetical protein
MTLHSYWSSALPGLCEEGVLFRELSLGDPRSECLACLLCHFELNGSPRLLLDHVGARSQKSATNSIGDAEGYEAAANEDLPASWRRTRHIKFPKIFGDIGK